MKLHKKITFGLLALTLVGPMTSCSDFLDEELTTQQNTDFSIPKKVLTVWKSVFTIICVSIFPKSGHVPRRTMVRMSFV